MGTGTGLVSEFAMLLPKRPEPVPIFWRAKSMNRRQFMTSAGWATLAVGTPAGYLFFRRQQLRAEARERLLAEALPPLNTLSSGHLARMPERAREEVRRFFYGKCLNVESFVSHICSNPFVEQVGR